MGFFNRRDNKNRPVDRQQSRINNPASASCPHCGTILDKVPSRKTKCPHCGKDIYVRTKQTLYSTPLLTESQADATDLIKNFEFLGLNDVVFRNKQSQLTAKFGTPASVDDTIWGIYNSLTIDLAKSGDFSQLSIMYGQMALFLTKRGKDGQRLMVEANKMTMRDYAKIGVLDFEIQASFDACPACKSLDGAKFKMSKELLEKPLLPPNNCSCTLWKDTPSLCGCNYRAINFKPFEVS